MRVPLSLIIDDSTALVNLAHFAIPQFAEVFPDQYQQDWRSLPREIPDAFVNEFFDYCEDHGVLGKYSMVPYPACTGWLDREVPGWSRTELKSSLELVRNRVAPRWDIHPEMITHTWVIDTKTGRPYPERTDRFMENWRWTDGKSVDQLAEYMIYALQILRNAGFACAGITTPGGFGNRVLPELAAASLQAVRTVAPECTIPHYFRHVIESGQASVAPRVELASGLNSPDPRAVVSIIGCTGDWFGGWDGLEIGHPDRFLTPDGTSGRLVEVIQREEPAVLVCHWPGMYCNGQKQGFQILQTVVNRLETHFDHLLWMNLDNLARAWAARTLTTIERIPTGGLALNAPFDAPDFTLRIESPLQAQPILERATEFQALREVDSPRFLEEGTYTRVGNSAWVACFALPRGRSTLNAAVSDSRPVNERHPPRSPAR
jgi:hypothetical protein